MKHLDRALMNQTTSSRRMALIVNLVRLSPHILINWGGRVSRRLSIRFLIPVLLSAPAGFASSLLAQEIQVHPAVQEYAVMDNPDYAQAPSSGVPQGSANPQGPSQTKTPSDSPATHDSNASKVDSPQPKAGPDETSAQQTKRILWIIPNYRSVSADTYLPPQSAKEKFWLATQDSFDYSAFIYEGMLAGVSMAGNSQPSFGQGASGYGNYFAHTFADGTIENYMVEAVVPTLTKEDPRYYTLGKGGFFKRTGYAVSRMLITRRDSGANTFNLSEVVGAGAAAGISNSYYPADTNVWVKTYQRWLSQMAQDCVSNIAKEFWPDINRAIFRNKF
jgi:hypothetical protein